ncbi:MAG: hypothetical protein AAF224_05135 [Pseudomonadota bacterium]
MQFSVRSIIGAMLALGVAPLSAEGPTMLQPAMDSSVIASMEKPDSVLVKGGEHKKFSRVVIEADNAPYKIDFSRRKIRVIFPGALHTYDLALINDKRKAHRVIKGRPVDNVGESGLEFDLNCNCGARVDYSKTGALIVDISEAYGATPTGQIIGKPQKLTSASDAKAKGETIVATRETDADAAEKTDADLAEDASRVESTDTVETARSKMLALLTQAADEGLVTFKDEAATTADPVTPAASTSDGTPRLIRYKCAPNNQFFPAGTGAPLDAPLEKISALQSQLVGEFDAANEDVVRTLYWTYLSIGFGDEAGDILEAFPLPPVEQEFLTDLALVVADRELPEDSPLRRSYGCRGVHALWRAVGLSRENPGLALREADPWAKGLARLPVELRGDFATRLGLAAVAAQEWGVVGRYQQEAAYVKESSAAFKYLSAEYDRHRGREEKARALFTDLAQGQSEHQRDALFALADDYAKTGEAPPEGFTEDLGMAAAVSESTAIKEKAIVMEATALISAGELDVAFQEIIRTYRAAPGARVGLGLAARTLIMEAMTSGDDAAKLAALDAYMDHQSFWNATANDGNTDALHTVAARTAVAFGLPNAATQSLTRRVGDTTAEAKLIAREINALSTLTTSPLGAGVTGRGTWEKRLDALAGDASSTVDAKKRLATAYLAGATEAPEGVDMESDDAANFKGAFRASLDPKTADAAALKKLADDASADVALLREIVNGR